MYLVQIRIIKKEEADLVYEGKFKFKFIAEIFAMINRFKIRLNFFGSDIGVLTFIEKDKM